MRVRPVLALPAPLVFVRLAPCSLAASCLPWGLPYLSGSLCAARCVAACLRVGVCVTRNVWARGARTTSGPSRRTALWGITRSCFSGPLGAQAGFPPGWCAVWVRGVGKGEDRAPFLLDLGYLGAGSGRWGSPGCSEGLESPVSLSSSD